MEVTENRALLAPSDKCKSSRRVIQSSDATFSMLEHIPALWAIFHFIDAPPHICSYHAWIALSARDTGVERQVRTCLWMSGECSVRIWLKLAGVSSRTIFRGVGKFHRREQGVNTLWAGAPGPNVDVTQPSAARDGRQLRSRLPDSVETSRFFS